MITVLGPTASGKTRFAAHLADRVNAEIISADSRQVYRGMNLGTGKDYEDYLVNGRPIPWHLIDIREPGYHYNLYEFQKDFLGSFMNIKSRGKQVILCGGTGMYIESVVKGFKILQVPVNKDLRESLERKSMDELIAMLGSYRHLHNISDTSSRPRLVRAIEIEEYQQRQKAIENIFPELKSLIIGLNVDRDTRRERITNRLKDRLNSGMVHEVKQLLEKGLAPEELIFYGLEYKYLTLYVTGKLKYDEMTTQLNTSIHQFAKRQITYFRKMERQGVQIHWLDTSLGLEKMLDEALKLLEEYN